MKKRRKPSGNRNKRSNRRFKPSSVISQPVKNESRSGLGRSKLIAKFLVVGLLNTVVGYGFYGILVLLQVPYLAALFMSTIMGVVFNYFSTGKLVFKSSGGRIIFAKFIAAYSMVYCINAVMLDVLVKHYQFDPYIGQALCVPLSVVMSWLLMNHWVYKKD